MKQWVKYGLITLGIYLLICLSFFIYARSCDPLYHRSCDWLSLFIFFPWLFIVFKSLTLILCIVLNLIISFFIGAIFGAVKYKEKISRKLLIAVAVFLIILFLSLFVKEPGPKMVTLPSCEELEGRCVLNKTECLSNERGLYRYGGCGELPYCCVSSD